MDLHVPIRIGGDATQVLGYVENLIESGSPSAGPRLNAPFGQQYTDFPLGPDLLNFALLRLVAFFTNDVVATVTIFFLLTFPLVAVVAYGSMRGLGVSKPVAYFGAVVFAVVPFHFGRATTHLFLSAYFAVPIAAYLLVRTIQGRALFGLDPGRAGQGRLRRIGVPVALAAVIATTGIYYAVFTLLLLVPAAILGWVRSRSGRVLVSAGLAGAIIAGLVLVTMLPNFVSTSQNGPNADFPIRGAAETGINQLRPITLVMPVSGHYVPQLASLASRFETAFADPGENGESAGFLAVIGLVVLAVVALGSLVGAFSRRTLWRKERGVAALVLVCLGIAASGGASSLFALLVTPQIRAWARFSIFIDFFALLALAFALSLAWRYLRRTRWRNVVIAGLVLGIVFAAVDQTGTSIIPNYDGIRTTWLADGAFTRQVEASLPAGAAVYQIPYRQYPEAGTIGDIPDYEPLRPYLQSSALRFSFGGEKGREAGWQDYVFDRPAAQVLPLLCLAQFSAIWLDRASYGTQDAALAETGLVSALAQQPVVNESGRFAVFDIRPYCDRLRSGMDPTTVDRLQGELMAPIWTHWDRGALPARVPEGIVIRDVRLPAQLSLVNAGDANRPVTVSFNLAAVYGSQGLVQVEWPDGVTEAFGQGSRATRTIELAPGQNVITFSDGGGTQRAAQFLMSDFYAVDPDLLAMVP